MNSSVAREFLRDHRRSNIHLYPDDWKKLPIPDVVKQQQDVVAILVGIILSTVRCLRSHAPAQSARHNKMLAYWEQILNGLVYELYFLDEVHGAGLRLFDLVEQAGLPDIDSIPEPQRLDTLREKFEDLYDGHHPLRIALDKLQTLDTVRIIEGKA